MTLTVAVLLNLTGNLQNLLFFDYYFNHCKQRFKSPRSRNPNLVFREPGRILYIFLEI